MPYRDKEKLKRYQREYRARDSEKWLKYNRVYYCEHGKQRFANETKERREKRIAGARAWRKKNKLRANAISREYYYTNRDKTKVRNKKNVSSRRSSIERWREENRGKYLASQKASKRKRRAKSSVKLNDAMSCRIYSGLKSAKAGRTWRRLVEYTFEQLMVHLERQFVPGMTWGNYGADWHVDHIVPLKSFSFTSADDPEFRAAWALSNLRPLWAKENKEKSAKRIYLI